MDAVELEDVSDVATMGGECEHVLRLDAGLLARLPLQDLDMRTLELPDLNATASSKIGLYANADRGVVGLTCSSPAALVLVDFEEEEEEDDDDDEEEDEEMDEEEEDSLVEMI
jgi:hypothetical protein